MTDIPIQPNQEIPLSVGQTLRSAREAQSLTLEQIAEKLKLSIRQLAALEQDDYQSLPGNTFVRGFVRNYARQLGLDPQPLLDLLVEKLPQERTQVALPRVGDATALNTPARTPRGDGSLFLTGLMVVLGLLMGAGVVWWYLQSPSSPEVDITDTSTAIELQPVLLATERTSEPDSAPMLASAVAASGASAVANVTASVVSAKPVIGMASAVRAASAPLALKPSTPAVASKPAASKPIEVIASAVHTGMIRVVADFDSWVQIVDADGKVLISQLVTPGTERFASGKAPFRIKVGNAPKTRVYYRGKLVDLAPFAKADVATLELK